MNIHKVVVAPEFDDDALEIFKTKKNIRVLKCRSPHVSKGVTEYKQISGGMLVQEKDLYRVSQNDLTIVSQNSQPKVI